MKPNSEKTDTKAASAAVERGVKSLLAQSPAFQQLPPSRQKALPRDMVRVAGYLVRPEGIAANGLPDALTPMQGLVDKVDFPDFVAGLIQGVFQAIVDSSIQQMEAYAELIREVAKTAEDFAKEAITDEDGRDWLVSTYPDIFEKSRGGKVRLVPNADIAKSLVRLRRLPCVGPLETLMPSQIESKLVAAARHRLAGARQQVLATMVLMGINRIVITDGRVRAKVGLAKN